MEWPLSPTIVRYATETAYGWVVSGSCRAGQQVPRSHLCVAMSAVDQQTQDLIIGFLQPESLAADDPAEETPSEEVQGAELDFVTNHNRLEDGRFAVTLPRKLDHPPLGHSRDRALRRHHHNAPPLTRKGKYQEFREAIWDYAKKLHAEKVPPGELYVSEHLSFYMPTHGVVKPQSTTTKLRLYLTPLPRPPPESLSIVNSSLVLISTLTSSPSYYSFDMVT